MYLYHITTKAALPGIMHMGLQPLIGKNAKAVNETKPGIYLCAYKDIPYWSILLDREAVFQVDIPKNFKKFAYWEYDEYITEQPIAFENMKRVYPPKPTVEHMKKLCMSYLVSISDICKYTASYYRYKNRQNNPYNKQSLLQQYTAILTCLPKIDYSISDASEIREYLKEFGESGEYTFCDRYLKTDKKLYQQLIEYPQDELTESRKQLYDYIIENLNVCLDMNTGSWTG